MKRAYQSIVLFLVFVFSLTHVSLACTTFCLRRHGEVLFGKNYDWMVGEGLIFVNKPNMAALLLTSTEERIPPGA
jgi:penicillin V acylase-like amidase (Ntn superfamily)